MDDLREYPFHCRRSIRKLTRMLHADPQIAYSMMKMTALLMDLRTDDERVVSAILMDCGIDGIEMEDIA